MHLNIIIGKAEKTNEIITMIADFIDDFIVVQKDIKKTTTKFEINLVAMIQRHSKD